MTEEKKDKLENILNILDRNNESYSFPVYIPSITKDVYFRELSTAQHKRLLKSTIDEPLYNSVFIRTFYHIIKENCTEEIEVDKLTLIDKMFILLHLRSVSIGDEIKIELESKKESGKKYKSSFKISDVLKKAKKHVNNIEKEVFKIGNYVVHCNIPNILTEVRMEEELRSLDDDVEITTPEQLREKFGEKFIGELIKYIEKIEVISSTNADPVVIELNEYSFKERTQIVEKMPSKTVENVIKYMEKINNEIEKITILNKKTNIGGETEEFEYQLTLDATFFTSFFD